jgi:hypothetical protein
MRALVKIGLLTPIAVLMLVTSAAAQNGTSSDEVLTNEKGDNNGQSWSAVKRHREQNSLLNEQISIRPPGN